MRPNSIILSAVWAMFFGVIFETPSFLGCVFGVVFDVILGLVHESVA
jgi:hypothetical protein